jgi:hypothetical protein
VAVRVRSNGEIRWPTTAGMVNGKVYGGSAGQTAASRARCWARSRTVARWPSRSASSFRLVARLRSSRAQRPGGSTNGSTPSCVGATYAVGDRRPARARTMLARPRERVRRAGLRRDESPA